MQKGCYKNWSKMTTSYPAGVICPREGEKKEKREREKKKELSFLPYPLPTVGGAKQQRSFG